MAKCIAIPQIPEPSLPGGISMSPPPLPRLSFPEGVCCRLPPLTVPSLPNPIPPIPLTAVIAVMKRAVAAINKVQKMKPLTCPRE